MQFSSLNGRMRLLLTAIILTSIVLNSFLWRPTPNDHASRFNGKVETRVGTAYRQATDIGVAHGFLYQSNHTIQNLSKETQKAHSSESKLGDGLRSPVYVMMDPLRGKIGVADWIHFSRIWDHRSIFSDILQDVSPLDMLPQIAHETTISRSSIELKRRKIVILHCLPKMASTTLRRACWEYLRYSCNVTSPKRDPVGYANMKEFADLLLKCDKTQYFCVMGGHVTPDNFPNFQNLTPRAKRDDDMVDSRAMGNPGKLMQLEFIHLFPFRNFDDWSASALKQIYVGHSEAGCARANERLEKCDNWLELDFQKYSKPAMSSMLDISKQLGNVDSNQSEYLYSKETNQKHDNSANVKTLEPSHKFYLYNFSHVHPTLLLLSKLHQIPILPYVHMQYKKHRQEGTCSEETLMKFHNCFDHLLIKD